MKYNWNTFDALRKKKQDGTISKRESKKLDILNKEAYRLDAIAADVQKKALEPILEKHKKFLQKIDTLCKRIGKNMK